mmetsp:Transcript_8782/g.13489  ORF Transcript_8782/g.13489 Transcript_8782/m.13489 type:complete len:91 (-) Transcript_8782:457-729(-)|eukprot:CAMPEP_0194558932 /NCGR_PEP_ID=MMETSP0292-20121207/661_1 /TAXON_ID=39354 /ORGANISM="Heterosigma akashiwo, Strain CCMP2393" /LENGTH=90 /DNA_ID=CAMNT_0039406703 /DNA_START=314 /DNA_END=586 /DNA_ORIENTATION=+
MMDYVTDYIAEVIESLLESNLGSLIQDHFPQGSDGPKSVRFHEEVEIIMIEGRSQLSGVEKKRYWWSAEEIFTRPAAHHSTHLNNLIIFP